MMVNNSVLTHNSLHSFYLFRHSTYQFLCKKFLNIIVWLVYARHAQDIAVKFHEVCCVQVCATPSSNEANKNPIGVCVTAVHILAK
jgi:hypothetical protein